MELPRSPKRSTNVRTRVYSIRNDRATLWEKYEDDNWRPVGRDLKDTSKTQSDCDPVLEIKEEEKENDDLYVDSDQETSDGDSSRGFWSPEISNVLRKRYSTFGKRTPRTISRILKHHRESERNRHHGINATIQAICQQIPGHVVQPEKKETKILKLQKIINYICHLEDNIHNLADELEIKLDVKNLFLSSHCNEEYEDVKLMSPKSPSGGRRKKFKSLLHRQQARNKAKRRMRIKISSPTVDSTTPDRPKPSQSGTRSRPVPPKSTTESPKTPVRGKEKHNWLSSTPRKDSFLEKSTLNDDDLDALGIGSPFLPTFLPSPDTTTLLSTEDCDQVLSVIDCPTPFSEADTSPTEFSDSELFLEEVLDTVENVQVIPGKCWENCQGLEDGDTLVSVEVPAHLVTVDHEPEDGKRAAIQKIFETSRLSSPSKPSFSSGVSAFHSYAKDPDFTGLYLPETNEAELDSVVKLEVPSVESEEYPDYLTEAKYVKEVPYYGTPVSKRFQTIKERTETTPTIKGFIKSGKGIASGKQASRCSSACSMTNTISGSPLRRSRRRPKPVRRSPFLPLSNIVVRDGEVTIKKSKEEDPYRHTFHNTESESEDEENIEPLITVPKVDHRKTTWMNGFMMYSRMHRRKYIMENRGTHTSHISKKMGQDWKRLSPEEKEPYSEQAKTYADRYLKPLFEAEVTSPNEQNEHLTNPSLHL